MKNILKLMSAVAVALTLAGCGGGGSSDGGGAPVPVLVSKADAVLPASPTVTAAVTNTPFAFPAGVPALGTTATTTIAFTSTSTTPNFSISSEGKTATGTTTFGSCIFTVTASTFLPPSPLAVGQVVRVDPCTITVDTSGQAATGQGETKSIALVLGAAASTDTPVTVSVNPGGELTLNGKSAGTVTLTPGTGTL